MKYEGQRFQAKDIELDGNEFFHCSFDHCFLIYRGGDIPALPECVFIDSPFEVRDAASNTLTFLKTLYLNEGNFRVVANEYIAYIRGENTPGMGMPHDD